MAGDGTPHTFSAEALRVEAERGFGERVQRWIAKAGARPVDVAAHLGKRREHLYKVFDGRRPMLAAWLELLPPAVELLYLAERAAHHGLELRPVASEGATEVRSHHLIAELSDVMRAASAAEADGHITAAEAEDELREWEDVGRLGAARREFLRDVIRQRGAKVRRIG